jgi:hypothetical protein
LPSYPRTKKIYKKSSKIVIIRAFTVGMKKLETTFYLMNYERDTKINPLFFRLPKGSTSQGLQD